MKLLIEIAKNNYKEMCEHGIERVDFDIQRMMKNATIIPDNATNGDVIKAMFPSDKGELNDTNGKILAYILDDLFMLYLADYWWNSPYKADKE